MKYPGLKWDYVRVKPGFCIYILPPDITVSLNFFFFFFKGDKHWKHCHVGKSGGRYLQDSEVFKNTVHHVLLGQVFELMDEVDHVLAHGGAVDPVNALSSLQAGVLRLSHTHQDM